MKLEIKKVNIISVPLKFSKRSLKLLNNSLL